MPNMGDRHKARVGIVICDMHVKQFFIYLLNWANNDNLIARFFSRPEGAGLTAITQLLIQLQPKLSAVREMATRNIHWT